MKVKLLGALRLFSSRKRSKGNERLLSYNSANIQLINYFYSTLYSLYYEISSIVFIKEMGRWEQNTKPPYCDTAFHQQ